MHQQQARVLDLDSRVCCGQPQVCTRDTSALHGHRASRSHNLPCHTDNQGTLLVPRAQHAPLLPTRRSAPPSHAAVDSSPDRRAVPSCRKAPAQVWPAILAGQLRIALPPRALPLASSCRPIAVLTPRHVARQPACRRSPCATHPALLLLFVVAAPAAAAVAAALPRRHGLLCRRACSPAGRHDGCTLRKHGLAAKALLQQAARQRTQALAEAKVQALKDALRMHRHQQHSSAWCKSAVQ